MTIEANSNTKSSGAVATAAVAPSPDIESGQMKHQVPGTVISTNSPTYGDENAGQGLGAVMSILLAISFIFTFFIQGVSIACVVISIIISSVVICGCCCASDYDLQPNVKRFASATLMCLCVILIMQIISVFAMAAVIADDDQFQSSGSVSEETLEEAVAAARPFMIASLALHVLALVFSSLFTCGRSYCTSS